MLGNARANANIALVKYWGRDKNLIPYNPSLAFTVDRFEAHTSVEFSQSLTQDEFIFDGKPEFEDRLQKVTQVLNLVRNYSNINLKAKVISNNTFPHSAGLASSAAGFCALVGAAFKALGKDLDKEVISKILSKGPSGSATRSVYDGFVAWEKDSAIQLYPMDYWPEFRDVIAIVERSEKKVGSNIGMQRTVDTSSMYEKRIVTAKNNFEIIRSAIGDKNHTTLFENIMKESNNMHAVMLDTYHPLFYLNDVSRRIIDAVHELNHDEIIAGYTFDAGPNAHIFTLEKYVELIKEKLNLIPGVQDIIICKAGQGLR